MTDANIAPKLLEQGILEALISVLTEGFDKALYLSCNQLLAILSSTLLSNDTETSCQQIMGNLLEMMTPSNDQLNRSALRAGKIISTSSTVAGKTLREAALAKGFVDILDGELRLKENPPETLVEAIGCISGLFRMKVKKEEMIQLKGPLDQLAHGEDNLVGEAAGGVMARYMHDVSSSSHRRRKRHRNGVANEWDMINDDSEEEESEIEQGPFNDVQFQLEQTMRSIKGINTSTRSRHSPSSPHRRNRFEPVVLPSLTVYDEEPRRAAVEIKFAYGSLPITELANRCSKRVGDYKWSTVVVDHTVTQVSMIVGVVDDHYRIRDNQQLGKVEPTPARCPAPQMYPSILESDLARSSTSSSTILRGFVSDGVSHTLISDSKLVCVTMSGDSESFGGFVRKSDVVCFPAASSSSIFPFRLILYQDQAENDHRPFFIRDSFYQMNPYTTTTNTSNTTSTTIIVRNVTSTFLSCLPRISDNPILIGSTTHSSPDVIRYPISRNSDSCSSASVKTVGLASSDDDAEIAYVMSPIVSSSPWNSVVDEKGDAGDRLGNITVKPSSFLNALLSLADHRLSESRLRNRAVFVFYRIASKS
ncbi:hypothetical protein BLNAU_17791 [Blattamonas nauphoetae]|uniref:Uncharacterized protein n=1 Tax=Blattamonas nauphoetae TaxID=2049346 RepID=A0ABQ9X6B5_9EUKA|nr:hypothetical protein BLNAU_17791 [Blattamonas nauphoetae]